MKTYRVVLDGSALSGFIPDEVRQRLAALIGRSEEAASRLLRGKPDDLPVFLVISFVACGVVFAIVHFFLRIVYSHFGKFWRKSSAQRENELAYERSRLLIIVAAILVAVTATYSVVKSYSIVREARDLANKQKEAAMAMAAAEKQSANRRDAEKAERSGKFAAERPGIISKAKSLLAQHKWEELARMDYDYGWARDAELNNLTDTARTKLYEIVQAKTLIAQENDRAERKRQGVSIGMTKEEVLMSSWGKPSSINSTSTRYGTHEQWVYDRFHNGYLYFDNGVLTAIQN